ncbi:GNAT family N-acetyltransferase [Photobacterium sanguinicancri]|uniref:GNAT family N-acetyltransferase n=1 Tax=Photobacterium sanguinicancri TaxID=875932 RepID=UPI0021C43CF9|nr:GNAT family N-acetyltransferase [Photobacterium sanguinicancri]
MNDIKVQVHDASENLIGDLKDFYHSYYSDDNRVFINGYLEWFLLKNPVSIGKCVIVTLEDKIIGNMFLIPLNVQHKGATKVGFFAADVLTHPEHRDKSLFIKMIRKTIEEVKEKEQFLIGHPNDAATPGWKRTRMKFGQPYKSYLSKSTLISSGVKHTEIKSKDDLFKYEDEINYLSNTTNLTVKTDCHFIFWKYMSNPSKAYKVEAVSYNGSLIGLIVSYKFKGIFDRVVHYLADEGFESKVLRSTLLPKIFSFPESSSMDVYKSFCYQRTVGTEVRFFFTDYTEDFKDLDPSYITFASCDN